MCPPRRRWRTRLEKRVFIIHELAVTEDILQVVLKYATENNARRVAGIHLQVGELRDLEEEWIQRYFDYLSRGTMAEGAKILVKRIPVTLACAECADLFHADIRQEEISCPGCGSKNIRLVSGREFLIEGIGVI